MCDGWSFAGKNPFPESPGSCPPLGIKSIFQASHDFDEVSNLSLSEDFGRESLGIFDFGRESLSFLQDDFGRESLGIINLDKLDVGRQSLGISNIKTYDFALSKGRLPSIPDDEEARTFFQSPRVENAKSELEVPQIRTTRYEIPDERTQSTPSFLNNAFLSSVSSTISSVYPTFNSSSLNSTLPSRISSESVSTQLDLMNDAFGNTTDFVKRMQLYVRSTAPTNSPVHTRMDILSKPRWRISSLPSKIETRECDLEKCPLLHTSFDKIRESLNQFDEVFDDNSYTDDAFNDSVFIEGKHVAEKIADGSLLEQDYMLDTTREPSEFANILAEEEPTKSDTETVFKTIDKFFISTNDNDENLSKNVSEPPVAHELLNTPRRSSSASSNSKSKDPIEIIDALSDILNDENRNEQKKNEGHNLLANLAEYFHSSGSTRSRSRVLDDSGHSSIESVAAMVPDASEVFEVLDLRTKSCSESNIDQIGEEICVPLDLSQRSKSSSGKAFISPKMLPPKLSRPQQKSLTNIRVNQSVTSNCSTSSNDSRNSGDVAKMFRPKKNDGKSASLKRGPMRAMLPVDTMAKRNSGNLKLTPKNSEPSTSKLKKTSTPINETSMRPIGQSTPDNPKNTFVSSPVARPSRSAYSGSKIVKPKLNYSGTRTSLNHSSDSESKPLPSVKKRSSGELANNRNSSRTLIRSQSTDGKLKSSSYQSPYRYSFSRSKTESSPNVLKENKISVVRRSSVVKKVGKENIHQK